MNTTGRTTMVAQWGGSTKTVENVEVMFHLGSNVFTMDLSQLGLMQMPTTLTFENELTTTFHLVREEVSRDNELLAGYYQTSALDGDGFVAKMTVFND